MRINSWHILWLILLAISQGVAQQNKLPYTSLPLQNLNAFRPVGSNWKLVSDVFYDVNKKGGGLTKSGSNILVNDPSGKSNDHLFTKLEHGDMDLELDYMMEKGSNSGVYLQGRYEVQLFDSWGVKDAKFSDCGAIYQRWDDSRAEGRKGYEGHPPAQNVSRAPGLWQHLQIIFQAPRFNQKGEKTANARFVKVVLNGVTVQQNIEVTGPTQAAAFPDEKPSGPLMIQGDHGPVAIRNITYKAYGLEPVTMSDLRLSAYDGKVNSVDELRSLSPKLEQPIDMLAHQAPGSRDIFAGKISGIIHVPHSGEYLFVLHLRWILPKMNTAIPNGAGALKIAGKKVLDVSNETEGIASTKLNLAAGDHPLELAYFKSFGKRSFPSNDILLSVEGPGVQLTTLTSIVESDAPVSQIAVLAKEEPVMQRGFINHHGRKHTHTISVGQPDGANYTVDLQKGELLQIWRGNFLETTPMWRGRGETQLSVPLGSLIELSGKPSLAFLADQHAAWPDSNATYHNLGYDVDAAGRPIFKYTIGTTRVRESFASADEGRKLLHSFTITSANQDIWCRVAEGSDISKLANGLYAINDKQYYIELPGNVIPLVRTTATNTKELLLPVKSTNGAGAVTYSIIW